MSNATVTWQTYAAPDLVTIPNVEIFRVGTWNGDPYSVEDLQGIVKASQEIGFTPPLKLGHMQDNDHDSLLKHEGLPAFGFVRNLRVMGESLVADFENIPAKLADLMRKGLYPTRSAEVWWGYSKNGKTWPKVLKAVALLGSAIPSIPDLKAIEALFAASDGGEAHYVRASEKQDDIVVDDKGRLLHWRIVHGHPVLLPVGKDDSEPAQKKLEAAGLARRQHAETRLRHVQVAETRDIAWDGSQMLTRTELSKHETGRLGEAIFLNWLRMNRRGAHSLLLNTAGGPSTPFDILHGDTIYEVKAGQVSNRPDAQKWCQKFNGATGEAAEREFYARLSPKDKKRFNKSKSLRCMARKLDAVGKLQKLMGRPYKVRTIGIVIDPDRRMADIFEYDGLHAIIRWNTAHEPGHYLGTVRYTGKYAAEDLAVPYDPEPPDEELPDESTDPMGLDEMPVAVREAIKAQAEYYGEAFLAELQNAIYGERVLRQRNLAQEDVMPGGMSLVLGSKAGATIADVQAVTFTKDEWSDADAAAWLQQYGYKTQLVEHEGVLVFTQEDPAQYGATPLTILSADNPIGADLAVVRQSDYTIHKRGEEWCLVAKSTGKTLGCHPSLDKAQAQERAVEASKAREAAKAHDDQTQDSHAVHGAGDTTMAGKTLEELQKENEALVARIAKFETDFTGLQKAVEVGNAAQAKVIEGLTAQNAALTTTIADMTTKQYDREDAQAVEDLIRQGKMPPAERDGALTTLKAARSQVFKYEDNGQKKEQPLAAKLLSDWGKRQVVVSFSEQSRGGGHDTRESNDPRKEVDDKVRSYQAKHPGTEYKVAMTAVFAEEPALKERYAQSALQNS